MLLFSVNQYAIMVLLGVRLLLLTYLFRKRQQFMITFWYELSLFLILLNCLFCEPEGLNYLSFVVLTSAFIVFGLFHWRQHWMASKSIFDYAENINEEEESIFDVLQIIE